MNDYGIGPSPDPKTGSCGDGGMYIPCTTSSGIPSFGCDYADGYMDPKTACSHGDLGGTCPDDPSLSFACSKLTPKGNSSLSPISPVIAKIVNYHTMQGKLVIYLLIAFVLFLIIAVVTAKNSA
jgi:hypothetical protein